MIDPLYQPYYQRSRDLEFHVHDVLGGHQQHPTAHVLREEVRRLTEDFEQKRNPRDVENRIKIIQRQIRQAETSDRLLSPQHSRAMFDTFERMRRDIRNHPHY